MPGKPDKQHRIRVLAVDGKPRDQKELNNLKSNQLKMPHLDIVRTSVATELIICAAKDTHIDQVREKLQGARLEEIDGGEIAIPKSNAPKPAPQKQQRWPQQQRRGFQQQRVPGGASTTGSANNAKPLPGKPYGFVELPQKFGTKAPIWHDGTSSNDHLSGEIRFELETLTPLLVGWERQMLTKSDQPWTIPVREVPRSKCAEFVQAAAYATYPDATDSNEQKRQREQEKVETARAGFIQRVQDHIVDVQTQSAGWSIDSKSVLCPLRAPWGERPVIIPGDSLKGLLRHELGALLGAPMERVAERSYSYRPNANYPDNAENRFLVPRIARVLKSKALPLGISDHQALVPTHVTLFPEGLEYNKKANKLDYHFDRPGGAPYRGGQGAGEKLNSKKRIHTSLKVLCEEEPGTFEVSQAAQNAYLATVRHLVDFAHGHFSERHPDAKEHGANARKRILDAAKTVVFQPGDLIWVEWDKGQNRIVSFGWHYYYRWAYTDSVRKKGLNLEERFGLFPHENERALDADGAPSKLSLVRRLFGYVGDNEGSEGIGKGDHSQLMGRVFVNAGLEVVDDNDSDDKRFLKPTFLKELGMPHPSAVEHYLKQPHHPNPRQSDNATLVTYGDAAGYDTPGELAGRKFYLDRRNAQAEDTSESNRQNERSTLALEASQPGRRFRFTVRFRDLDSEELAAILVALCPDQFKGVLEGTHGDGYCSKLGYARPLGWGSVCIKAKQLLFLDEEKDNAPTLKLEPDLEAWVKTNPWKTATQVDCWLAIHRRNHPEAADYPRDENGQIFKFHSNLRSEHSRNRRYRKGDAQ
ncbi:MAG: RAMP superfamily CRISPR-associated protein [Myxococcales bacterium]|jgi:CRISPR-associated protein (TIGR03986 family)|nr:RAMP superfamily CRISPR-associated protein [Myxococcales bacterium]